MPRAFVTLKKSPLDNFVERLPALAGFLWHRNFKLDDNMSGPLELVETFSARSGRGVWFGMVARQAHFQRQLCPKGLG
jgi:hypothetical protein